MRTVILDIDGCIFEHRGTGATDQWYSEPKLLPGVRETLDMMEKAGCCIILMTSRKECLREVLVQDLLSNSVPYDILIMGVPHYPRLLINDIKADGSPGAYAHNLPRNEGPISCLKELC